LCQTVERRCDVAQSDRAEISLRNPAAADMDRLVRTPAPGLVPKTFLRRIIGHRGCHSVFDCSSAQAAPVRVRLTCRAASFDFADGQLLLFQSADPGALRDPARRRGHSKSLADKMASQLDHLSTHHCRLAPAALA